ncbi:MAG: hypothetical protein ACOX6F_09510, partial [Syntrophomonadaceae bacterium]
PLHIIKLLIDNRFNSPYPSSDFPYGYYSLYPTPYITKYQVKLTHPHQLFASRRLSAKDMQDVLNQSF